MRHKYSFYSRKSLRTICIVVASMSLAFLLGIETSGDIEPVVGSLRAGSVAVEGDFNGNGLLDANDARIALEIAQGFRSPTTQELAADPDHDFHITVEDAMAILEKLEHLPSSSTAR